MRLYEGDATCVLYEGDVRVLLRLKSQIMMHSVLVQVQCVRLASFVLCSSDLGIAKVGLRRTSQVGMPF